MSIQILESERAAHAGNVVRSEVNRNADYDLEEWIQARVRIKPGERVLDVGCGNGKQVIAFSALLGSAGQVVGTDIFSQVPGLLQSAQDRLRGKDNVALVDHDTNSPFPYPDDHFDAVTSCYSIYYVDDIRRTLDEFRRLIRSRGRCFVVGPSWDNSIELYDLTRHVTGRDLPANFGSRLMRINDEVIPACYDLFDHVEVSPFVNRVYFKGDEGIRSFEAYYKSSLLYEEAAQTSEDKARLLAEVVDHVRREVAQSGQYFIYKRAIGLTLYKKK
jgi:ubiquinone/menaquinone biosynthesis C-methylase UbiE